MDITFVQRLSKIQGWANALIEQLATGPLLFLYIGISSVFLTLGTLAGLSAGKIGAVSKSSIPQRSVSPIPLVSTIQQNFLVIGVDSLDHENTRLESVWLVLYLPGNQHINFVSIYPSLFNNRLIDPRLIEKNFSLESDKKPGSMFLDLLRAEHIWWSYYAIVDEIGMIGIINKFGGLQLNGYHLTGSLALDALPVPWEDQETALRVQTSLLAGICEQASHISKGTDIAPILDLIPKHIQTDLDINTIIQDWFDLMINPDELVCEFPLLNTKNP